MPARPRHSAPTARDKVNPRDVRWDLYGYDRMSTAHLYAVPVLSGFDAVRNCSHCRRETDDDCAAWRKLRKSVAVLRQECRRYAKGVDELLAATGGRTATIYEFADGSVAHFTPDAPDFCEAGELKCDELAAAQRILDERGISAGLIISRLRSQALAACPFQQQEVLLPLAEIEALYGDLTGTVFRRVSRLAL